ncbi:membrane protein [Caballeronia mineralivorans PML1(12)]|uniref:Membrane protein n=1 Tax=Caballeronia mineralivorans PML1(12) TaxID=908627 RepID=A0A0J1D4V3_9BURK|nr:phage holin family protein [Caballeronia mineralivorans]KLU27651.1 membrane protein [Caballeronia mineralivorans PML1(12)]
MTKERQSQHDTQGPLRRIVSSVFAIFETRLELIGIELAEEKERLIGVLFLGLAAMMLTMMALITLTVLIAIAFWDTYRWQSLAAITLAYVLVAVLCAIRARAGLANAPNVFDSTLAEFKKDRDTFN